ncbi:MAG: type 1 glutamine amidotransferase [Burkholderiales bacterium]
MKPIAIFRHYPTEGPGYFASFLSRRDAPFILIKADEGEAIPSDSERFSALAFMGGPMSVNDDLAWIGAELELIRSAVSRDIPVLGHCLGGQLIAKALGGNVTNNRVQEIGWGEVKVSNNSAAREWLGDLTAFESFHWHGETFSLPTGATHILASQHCENQAFCLGPHLAMQCHVEMTPEMVISWADAGARLESALPSVQTREQMLANLAERTESLNKVAEKLYTKWIGGIGSFRPGAKS